MTKFGIYTSFYNSENYVDKCFQVIENLNYQNFCWHITDDFSEDDTKEVILNKIKKSPIKDKIFYYSQNYKKQMYWKPNQFFDNTFEWIVLLDSDDWFHPEALNIYNHFINNTYDEISLITSDFRKINEGDNSLDSISYIINDKSISKKIKNYHPKVDYLNNISYSLFGNLRCFKNNIDFKIDDNLACAEDSYRVFWCNSYGKYLHIPRPLYHWNKRKGSESHSKAPDNFNGNFDIAFNKLKKQDKGVSKYFNDIYIETSAMGSFDLDPFKTKQINLITRELSTEEKKKIKELYPEFEVFFNYPDKKLNIYCLNFIDERTLKNLNKNSINLFYFQDLDDYQTNQVKDRGVSLKLKHYRGILQKILPNPFSWWIYVRHFTITSIPEKPKKDTKVNLFENVLEESLVSSNNKFTYDLSDGLKVFVSGEDKEDYEFVFIDKDKQKIVFSTKETKPTSDTLWVSPALKYFVNWKVKVYSTKNKKEVSSFDLNLKNKKVFIDFQSSSLGDTIAWIPYLEEFRKKHNCILICSTFHNKLFKDTYPNIEFIERGKQIDFFVKYKLGWFFKEGDFNWETHPEDPKKLPLQKTASDILGLPFQEIQTKVNSFNRKKLNFEKYFTFSIQSTAQSKYWNYPNGWKLLIEELNKLGYKAVNVDLHTTFGGKGWINKVPDNSYNIELPSLEDTISVIEGAKFHIGISSGLSWLAWGLNKHVVLISGFSDPITEFNSNTTRISAPSGKCSSCFNRHKINPSDWLWCPDQKNTERQFECTTSISPERVFNQIKKEINL